MGKSFAQEKNPKNSFSRTNVSFSSTYGVHPNYTGVVNANYFQGEFDSRLKIFSVPVLFIGRISDEKYRSGRPSYFKASYDAASQKKIRINELNDSLGELNSDFSLKQQKLYELEGKLSFLKQKQYELANLPEKPTLDNNLIPNPIGEIPQLNLPNMEIAKLNLSEIEALEGQINLTTKELDDINLKKLEMEQLHHQVSYKKGLGFLDGIKKVDVGLSSLSAGSLSKNAIPIQGIHVAGVVRKTFYDVAAGVTMPNQLFSTSAFDQLINNNSNVFNLGSFFNVKTVRFVSSAILGYGEKDKKSVSIENFYTGRSVEQIRSKVQGVQSNSTNLNGHYTFLRLPFVTLNGTLGYSNYFNDTLNREEKDRLAYGAGVTIALKKITSLFKANIRTLGKSYDGFTQGIYLNGSDHYDFSFKKEFGRRIITNIRFAQDKFQASDSTQNISKTNLGSIDFNWKIGGSTSIYGNYALVEATSTDNQSNLSHLSRVGYYSIKHIKHTDWVNSADAGYARISGVDSNQILTQGMLKSELRFEKWFFSAKASYQKMVGLTRIYGVNWIFQPEIGIRLKDFEAGLSYQLLQSDQFSTNSGFQGYFSYNPSPYVTWSFSATRWLPSEYIFFLPEALSYTSPYFLRTKLSIHLNVNK